MARASAAQATAATLAAAQAAAAAATVQPMIPPSMVDHNPFEPIGREPPVCPIAAFAPTSTRSTVGVFGTGLTDAQEIAAATSIIDEFQPDDLVTRIMLFNPPSAAFTAALNSGGVQAYKALLYGLWAAQWRRRRGIRTTATGELILDGTNPDRPPDGSAGGGSSPEDLLPHPRTTA